MKLFQKRWVYGTRMTRMVRICTDFIYITHTIRVIRVLFLFLLAYMDIQLIQHNTPEYNQMVTLRLEILRTPLGLTFTEEQLEKEKDDILIGAFEEGNIIGCCVLTPHNSNTIQLRQMAVATGIQAKGAGRKIVEYAEETALDRGYSVLMMHARNTALDFYRKCGYEVKGNEFIEVTIPHHHMEKKLK